MVSHFYKIIIIICLLITSLSMYHCNITQIGLFSLVGFMFEFLLILIFLLGVRLGKTLNNNQLNRK